MIRHLARFSRSWLPRDIKKHAAVQSLIALKLAKTSKQLHVCAPELATVLLRAGSPSLEGKVCLEVGSGWVLTHAVTFHLLGARKVYATDLARLARPRVLRAALDDSLEAASRDALAAVCDYERVRRRLERFSALPSFDFESLEKIGLHYLAPIDLAVASVPEPVDFVFSNSVFEHVAVSDAPRLLANLVRNLSPGGIMIHNIHLEDHKDMDGDPFRFLEDRPLPYTDEEASWRGNRLRVNQWLEVFNDLSGCETSVVFQHRRSLPIPEQLAPEFRSASEEDLRVTHLSLLTRKLA